MYAKGDVLERTIYTKAWKDRIHASNWKGFVPKWSTGSVWVSRGGWDGQALKSCVCPLKELELFPAGDKATRKAFMRENDMIRL